MKIKTDRLTISDSHRHLVRKAFHDARAIVDISTKSVLTARECARYTGLSLRYLYRLTSEKKIPHFKPRGKMLYFRREEIDKWLTDGFKR